MIINSRIYVVQTNQPEMVVLDGKTSFDYQKRVYANIIDDAGVLYRIYEVVHGDFSLDYITMMMFSKMINQLKDLK